MALVTFIKKLFGGDERAGTPGNRGDSSTPGRTVTLKELEGFVNYVVRALVDFPDEVRITTKTENGEQVIWITCRKEDMGKIIGKKGKTIIALRALVAGAAGRMHSRVRVEVTD